MMTNWKNELEFTMKINNETLADLISNTMTDEEMLKMFDADYGSPEGIPFTDWSRKYVYFPLCYDGSESVGFVSRKPDGKPTDHWGGY